MIRSYFKTALRNLLRHKNYTLINIAGLAVGIAVCLIIFIVIQYQSGFDAFHEKGGRAYRVITEYHNKDAAAVTYGKDVPFPLPAALKLAAPEIEQVAPVFASHNDVLLIQGDSGRIIRTFKEDKGVFFTTPSFFSIFQFPLLAGSYASLTDPNNVLLTKEVAEKYFGNWESAIGKTIQLEAGGSLFSHGVDVLKVTGVLASIPANTDLQLKLVVAYGTGITEDMQMNTNWQDRTNADFGCYVLLPEGIAPDRINQQLRAYSQKAQSPENKDLHMIQPVTEIHYDTQASGFSNNTISKELLNVLWLIAAFIVLIACVNFVNLATAQAVNRAKEIGVRKVLGGSKFQLRFQFVMETFLIVFISVLIAVAIAFLLLPYVNQLLDLNLSIQVFKQPSIIVFLLLLTMIVTVVAGFYPSMVLSRFNPVQALKSKLTVTAVKGISLRRALVVFQFIIAQVLIIGTFIIVQQMNYFIDQPLGFNKDAVVNVPFRVDSLRISRLEVLRQKLMQINGVQGVSFASNTPVEDGADMWYSFRYNRAANEADFKAITKFADEQYVATYGLKLVAGRNLQPSPFTREFLVNETMVKSLGLKNPEEILNKEISMWDDRIKCQVVGVVKDFNDRSFRHEVAPLLISTNVTMYSQAGIKLETANMQATLAAVQKVWEETFPNFVYDYRFLDEKIAGFYKQESQLSQLYKIFAAIAIFLSCLGLYGLASFMAAQRVKEVGIRKVLGATAASIVYMFSKEFILLITIAFVIAAPIAWYYMQHWLQDYVYRINISWWLFLAAGAVALIIALLTISFQAIRAASANPVKSLRAE